MILDAQSIIGKASRSKSAALLLSATLMSTILTSDLPANAKSKSDNNSKLAQSSPTDAQDPVVKALLTLRFAANQGDSIVKDIDHVNRYLEETMLQVSYPVLIPATETNPVTLATPNPEVYTGHFQEERNKSVTTALQKIGQELSLLDKYIKSIYIPDDKRTAVGPLLNDVSSTFAAATANFALVQQASSGPKIDAEIIAVKLSNIQKDITTVDNDLKSIFQIVNLKNASQDTMSSIANMRMLTRDTHWLGLAAKYLHDNARELNPDAAIIQDAEDQNWLVFGTPEGGYKGLNKNPYEPLKAKQVTQRMTELSQYVAAVGNDINALKTAGAPAAVKSLASQMQSELADIQNSYRNLQTLTSTEKYDTLAIAKEADSIAKNTVTIHQLSDKVAAKLLNGKTVL